MRGKSTTPNQVKKMVEFFFGDNPEDPQLKQDFAKAWQRPARPSHREAAEASDEYDASKLLQKRVHTDDDFAYRNPDRYKGSMIPEPTPPDPGHPLFEFRIDMPPQDSTEESFDLLMHLIPQAHRDPDIAADVGIGLHCVTVEYTSDTCDPTGDRAGKNNISAPGIQKANRGCRYVAPREQALLDDYNDIFSKFIWARRHTLPSVGLRAWAHASDIRAIPIKKQVGKRTSSDTVREKYLEKIEREGLGENRIIELGTATLSWKRKP